MMDTPTLTLYTVGHSNLAPEAFLTLLMQHNITILVDVRSAPYSRYVPHFNKHQLQVFLKANGLDYRYAGEYLGGQPKDPTLYKEQAMPAEDTKRPEFLQLVDYEAIMKQDTYQKGIQRLIEIVHETAVKGGHVGIMCSEANPHDCHRHHLLARSLIDPTVRVISTKINIQHILKDGKLETVDEAAFTANKLPRQPKLF